MKLVFLCALVFWLGTGFTACAKHVRLHAQYGTWTDTARFDLSKAGMVTLGCPSAPGVAFVDLTFNGVPEWLDGDGSVAFASMAGHDLTIAGIPTVGAFIAWRDPNILTPPFEDDYYFSAKVNISATDQIVVTPPDTPSFNKGEHTISVGHEGCWNVFFYVPLRSKTCPYPQNTGCLQYQTKVLIPMSDHDQLDPCAWDTGHCGYQNEIRQCDAEGCVSFCPDGASYDQLSCIQEHEVLCCPCPPR